MKLVTKVTFNDKQLAQMTAWGVEVHTYPSDAALIEAGEHADADIIIADHRTLQEPFLEQCKALRWVQVPHIGIERLPMDTLKARDILVINARGALGVPIAEHILCQMLMLSRKSKAALRNQQAKAWVKEGGVLNLSGKTVGIVGTGDVGTETAIRARSFGMRTIGINTDGRAVEPFERIYTPDGIHELIEQSDFVVLTLPLTDRTTGMIGREELARMKPTAHLLNISRGALIDKDALVEAFREKRIAGAALDVFIDEFKHGLLPESSPFWDLDNILITPHVAGAGDGFGQRFCGVFMGNLERFVKGDYGSMVNVRQFGKGY